MTEFSTLPMEIRELILSKLPNEALVECRRVSRDVSKLACHILNRRHLQIWRWNPYFTFSHDDDWTRSKILAGVLAGGMPNCCVHHIFEKTYFSTLKTKSLLIWIEYSNMSASLNQVVKPFLRPIGTQLTSFTLLLADCCAGSVPMGDLSSVLKLLPNLRNFAFKACGCSMRSYGHYNTRYAKFPPLPHLEVLDLTINESPAATDAILQAYGDQIKSLIIPCHLLQHCEYLRNALKTRNEKPAAFGQLRDIKISDINGVYEPPNELSAIRRKYAGKDIFSKFASLPGLRLERISLNIDDWALHKSDRWCVATLELVKMISNVSETITELNLHFEYFDRSMDTEDWNAPAIYQLNREDNREFLHYFRTPSCPNLRKVSVDAILLDKPLLLHLLQKFGHVQEVQFLMWNRYDRHRVACRGLNIPNNNFVPSDVNLPNVVAKLWKDVRSLRRIIVYGTNNEVEVVYEWKRTLILS